MDEVAARFVVNAPDEVFTTFERLFFQLEQAHWFYMDFFPDAPRLGLKEFTAAVFRHCPQLQPHLASHEEVWAAFQRYYKQIPVMGAIMLNAARDSVVLVRWGERGECARG